MQDTKMNKDLAIIILAAGSSSRLKTPKQLIQYKGESLLQIAVKNALNISNNVFVILGSNKELCQNELQKFDITTLYNKNYKEGMGTSLSFGIQHTKEFENTLVMLCDQPFLPTEHLQKITQLISQDKIIATLCENKLMVPALFPKKHYPKILELIGDKGARDILKNGKTLNVELAKNFLVDIDTQEDIIQYLK